MLVDKARRPETAQPCPAKTPDFADERVQRADLLIEDHINEPLSVQEIADRLSISARQLERRFTTSLGIGI